MTSIFDELLRNSEQCVAAIRSGDFDSLGSCLNAYWTQKKRIAAGVAPPVVKEIIRFLHFYLLFTLKTFTPGSHYRSALLVILL